MRLEPVWVGSRKHAAPAPSARAVFLDRDGVLNEVTGDGTAALSPRSVEEVRISAGAQQGVLRLREAGFALIVVSNQPDIARGSMDRSTATAIMRFVVEALDLDGGYFCPHQNSDGCPCRKPRSGMVESSLARWKLARVGSWLVGDRWVDIGAAQAAGLPSVLIERTYSWDASGGIAAPADLVPVAREQDFGNAVGVILAGERR